MNGVVPAPTRVPARVPMRVPMRLPAGARAHARALAFALGLLGWAACPAWAACPPAAADGKLLGAAPVQLAWRIDGPPVANGRHFALLIQVCPAEARLTKVDAGMPEHRHGMNYRPSLQALGDGRWRADGLMFHMLGRWELVFEAEAGGRRERLVDEVVLK
jgi:hypothetical protein